MPGFMEIVQIGYPVLRKKASPVAAVESPKIQRFIDDLSRTLMEEKGVGIAAPQVNVSLRLFIIASHPDPRYSDAPEMEPEVIINPEIIAHSQEMVKGWEGCLSIPGIRGLVPRYRSIALRYTKRDGSQDERIFTDFSARICQHEIDHLDGIVYLDRMESPQDIVSDAYYRELPGLDAQGGEQG
ncbi:MAG: peptide deformylase [Syntrophus sp. (in: bacteria)]|nr:peptide deformylase [Syntrophus sp. (in: bacteria)]